MRSRPYDLRHPLCGLLASLALGFTSVPVTGLHAANMPSAVVRYDGRDLASDASAQRLLQRIEIAARDVCFEETREPLPMQQAARRCALAAVAHAVDSIRAPRLTAAYVARYGPKVPSPDARHGPFSSMLPSGP
jgi:UrcA family protein